jgi:enterochelin esterase-like enzyme
MIRVGKRWNSPAAAAAVVMLILAAGSTVGCDRSSRSGELTDDPGLFNRFLTRVDTLAYPARQELANELIQTLQKSDKYAIPYVEDSTAVFLYRGHANRVRVAGDWNQWQPEENMSKVEGTSLFYLEMILPPAARLDYKFVVDGVWILDPLNPATSPGGYGVNSELAMPQYIPPAEIERKHGLPQGTLEPFTWTSPTTGTTRDIQVYLPAGYNRDSARKYPVLYVHDGREYLELGQMAHVLNNSIGNGLCRPLVAVFVDPVNREEEYHPNHTFLRMFTEELVPMIEDRYRILDSPDSRGVMGVSLGGVTALDFTLRQPDLFGLAAGQSSALWIDSHWLVNAIEEDTSFSATVVLQWGQFDPEDIVVPNRQLRDILEKRDKTNLFWSERPQGYAWGHWRSMIDEILIHLYPPVRREAEVSGEEEHDDG